MESAADALTRELRELHERLVEVGHDLARERDEQAETTRELAALRHSIAKLDGELLSELGGQL